MLAALLLALDYDDPSRAAPAAAQLDGSSQDPTPALELKTASGYTARCIWLQAETQHVAGHILSGTLLQPAQVYSSASGGLH